MSLLSGTVTLDLSRLPAPDAIKNLDLDAMIAARADRLQAALQDAGIDYDLAAHDANPLKVFLREDAYAQFLDLVRVNDAVRALLIATSTGSDLDNVGATIQPPVERLDGEDDERFRERILLASEARAGGRLAGYIYEAMTASLDVSAASAAVVQVEYDREVSIYLQGQEGDGSAAMDLVEAVDAHIQSEVVKQATDIVVVSSVAPIEYTIEVQIEHRPGPDPSVLRENAVAALTEMCADRFSPGRDVPISAITRAAFVDGVESVQVNEPTQGVVVGSGEIAHCSDIQVVSLLTDG